MKTIYAGDQIAAVILDSDEEIATVVQALAERIGRGALGDRGSEVAMSMYREMTSPEPDKDPRWEITDEGRSA